MIPYHSTSISLCRIETSDLRYRISTGTAPESLTASIEEMGVLTPPWLLRQGSDCIIVSGFKRIEACRRLNHKSVKANLIDVDTSEIRCTTLAIADNALQRPLNLLEQARAYGLLDKCIASDTKLRQTACLVGLPNTPEMVRKIAGITKAPESLQEAIRSKAVSLAMALEIMEMPVESADLFSDLFHKYKPGLNRQREFVTLVTEIAQREDISPADILGSKSAKVILEDEKRDSRKKVNLLLYYLRTRRFPELGREEKRVDDLLRAIQPGQGIKIVPPPFFESRRYTVQIDFSSVEELKSHHERLHRIIQNPHLKALFNLS